MSKDYAKRPSARRPAATSARGAKTRARRPVPGWLWLATLAAVLASIYGLYWLKSRQSVPVLASGSLPLNQLAQAKPQKKILPPPPTSQWTFHEVLAEKTVDVPDAPVPASDPAAPPASYVLACGTFAGIDRAESLKAQLALAGLHAQVKPVNRDGATRYWVGTGPHATRRLAHKDQMAAQAARIESCQIR